MQHKFILKNIFDSNLCTVYSSQYSTVSIMFNDDDTAQNVSLSWSITTLIVDKILYRCISPVPIWPRSWPQLTFCFPSNFSGRATYGARHEQSVVTGGAGAPVTGQRRLSVFLLFYILSGSDLSELATATSQNSRISTVLRKPLIYLQEKTARPSFLF